MSSLEIRPAIAADLPSITEIYAHEVRFGTATFELVPPDLTEMTRRFQALIDGGFPYFVAVLEGSVVGYAYASSYRPRPAYRFTVENSVYLRPATHRRGIGRQILERAIADKATRAFVDTAPVNDKISQRLIQILEFRGLPQRARLLTPRPIIALIWIWRAKNRRWLKPSASTA